MGWVLVGYGAVGVLIWRRNFRVAYEELSRERGWERVIWAVIGAVVMSATVALWVIPWQVHRRTDPCTVARFLGGESRHKKRHRQKQQMELRIRELEKELDLHG